MKYHKKVLKNGLRVITVPDEDSLAATVLVMVAAGSKYETRKINGLSHFLEHMCFKGTKKRPRPGMISHELDALGAQSNAFTSQEYTGYYAKVPYQKLGRALEIVADLYLNPIFNPAEVEKEKGVVIEEIRMYKDLPQRQVWERWMELLYGAQPAGWSIAGDEKRVRGLTRKQIVDYRARHYVAPSTTVIVSGRINKVGVMKEIEKLFSALTRAKKQAKPRVKQKQSKPQVKIEFKKTDQTHTIVGVRTYNLFDRRDAVLEVLSGVLGEGMSSRLFLRIREELGAAYYVSSSSDLYTDHGYLAVRVGADNRRAGTVIRVILEEFARLKRELVQEKELQKAKDHAVGNLFLNLETSDSMGQFYGLQNVLKNKIQTPKEYAARLQKVTARQIREVARDIFQNRKLNLAMIGPFKNTRPFEKILKI